MHIKQGSFNRMIAKSLAITTRRAINPDREARRLQELKRMSKSMQNRLCEYRPMYQETVNGGWKYTHHRTGV